MQWETQRQRRNILRLYRGGRIYLLPSLRGIEKI
jgi:hypothetical protein